MATFKLRANELTGETGLTLFLYPPGETVANGSGDALSESSGLFTATVAESLTGWHDYFIYQSGLSIYRGRVYCDGATWIADQADSALAAIKAKTDNLPSDPADASVVAGLIAEVKAKTDLIGTGSALVGSPVTELGDIEESLLIGDDYLAANARAFQWDIDPVTGFTLASVTCWFGAKRNGKTLFLVEGEASLVSGKWRLVFELTKAITSALTKGEADWSVAVHEGDVEITRVRPQTNILTIEEKCT